jgi:glucose-1-phosphate cytidylyltransferase
MENLVQHIVLLAGGLGTRLREETEFTPKPMVKIGDKPVLWHIMKNLSHQGLSNFVIATGYKSEAIKDYFINYETRNNDFTINLGKSDKSISYHGNHDESDWSVTIAYTGENTNTGGRVKAASKYLESKKPFMVTYGDGLADIDLNNLIRFHKMHGKLATVTTVRPISRFGVMEVSEDGEVKNFKEKPILDGWINIGFFVFEPKVLDLLTLESVLELDPLEKLADMNELMAYRHPGFWQPMDTYREFKLLNDMWENNSAPWKNWNS